MIQMKTGFYGNRNLLIRPEDGPFSLTKEEEERLVKRGVAEYVDGTNPFEGLKATELRAIAKANGLTLQFGMTNAAMAAYLQLHKAKYTPPVNEDDSKGQSEDDKVPAESEDTKTDSAPAPGNEEQEQEETEEVPVDEETPTFDATEAVK